MTGGGQVYGQHLPLAVIRTYPKSNIYCTPFRGVRLWRKIYTVLTVICKLSKCNIVAVCNNSFF
ncbi:MAG: hypothetical protein ABRQ39_24695, partial [Candidatus Eremiobacterota bacterium]